MNDLKKITIAGTRVLDSFLRDLAEVEKEPKQFTERCTQHFAEIAGSDATKQYVYYAVLAEALRRLRWEERK